MEPYIKPLPKALTTYDFLKLLAVVTMIIDHVGHYFFPEQLEWRAIGRMSMPIWLFLVGYANTREIPTILWGGALVLLASYLVFGNSLLSLNILFTIIITRFVLDALIRLTFQNNEMFFLSIIGLLFLAIPTTFLFDYGTQAFMWALVGYVVRNREQIGWNNGKVLGFMALISIIYMAYQALFFGFNQSQTVIMMICVATSFYFLYNFKGEVLPDISAKTPVFLQSVIKFCGRKTLHIYVGHLIFFLMIALFVFPDRFGLFHLKLY